MTALPPSRPSRIGLFLFEHDLRLHDQAALTELANNVDQLLCVYVFNPRQLQPTRFQSKPLGQHRLRFLQESLTELDLRLQKMGQRLLLLEGDMPGVVAPLASALGVTHVARSAHPGPDEQNRWERLKEALPGRHFQHQHSHTLFQPQQLPFELDALPKTFTPFRKVIEQQDFAPPSPAITTLPAPPTLDESLVSAIRWQAKLDGLTAHKPASGLQGGETAAIQQLDHYLEGSDRIASYKETRNGMLAWEDSSKLSAWLANGSLSVRYTAKRIREYEAAVTKNDSTYWLYFELLWREYFQWSLYQHGAKFFRFRGVRDHKPLTSFYPERFARWCHGDTPYPIVNAGMRQLKATGYLSNRARQLVASCLVHELALDWRYGAAWFEQELLDYDVASNWGNWQYLAGVGADPRGQRRFDLAAQAERYDPKGEFVAAWGGNTGASSQSTDSVDAADWPVT